MNRPAKIAVASAVCLGGLGAAYYAFPRLVWRALVWLIYDEDD
jgi:hypothetical protein